MKKQSLTPNDYNVDTNEYGEVIYERKVTPNLETDPKINTR